MLNTETNKIYTRTQIQCVISDEWVKRFEYTNASGKKAE